MCGSLCPASAGVRAATAGLLQANLTMCGFLQVFQRGRPVDRRRFDEAFALVRHRGPDFSATIEHAPIRPQGKDGPEIHCVSGHHRLSILDLDPRSNQPFRRAQSTLLHNGESYKYRDVRRLPALAGRAYATTGDTETLFEGLRALGADLLPACNGMWALTFFDTDADAGTVLAARDRYGKKPLFYHVVPDVICIASTIAAICRYLGTRPRLRRSATDAFLLCGIMWPGAGVEAQIEPLSEVAPGGQRVLRPAGLDGAPRHRGRLRPARGSLPLSRGAPGAACARPSRTA